MSLESTYTVTGMSCEHCISAVRREVGALDGVESVEVDLTTGAVRVTSRAPLDPEQFRAAIDEAGYEVAP